MVLLSTVLAIGLVYGVGHLLFAWWDGGVLRRILLMACAVILVYGVVVFVKTNLTMH